MRALPVLEQRAWRQPASQAWPQVSLQAWRRQALPLSAWLLQACWRLWWRQVLQQQVWRPLAWQPESLWQQAWQWQVWQALWSPQVLQQVLSPQAWQQRFSQQV
jgi:hypothetical protein